MLTALRYDSVKVTGMLLVFVMFMGSKTYWVLLSTGPQSIRVTGSPSSHVNDKLASLICPVVGITYSLNATAATEPMSRAPNKIVKVFSLLNDGSPPRFLFHSEDKL